MHFASRGNKRLLNTDVLVGRYVMSALVHFGFVWSLGPLRTDPLTDGVAAPPSASAGCAFSPSGFTLRSYLQTLGGPRGDERSFS